MEMETDQNLIFVEVCYATSDHQHIEALHLKKGSTLQEALLAAEPALRTIFPDIVLDLQTPHFGIFSQSKPLETPLKNHDRVEIYRPLKIDPMMKKQLRQAERPIRKIAR